MKKQQITQNLQIKKEIIQHLISFLKSESDSIDNHIKMINDVYYDLENTPDELLENLNTKEEYHNYYNSIVETLQEPVIDCVYEIIKEKKYKIVDSQAGNKIEDNLSYEEANKLIKQYEQEDIDDGNYTVGFYEIIEE